ncbi:hypothetical protein C9J85_13655 [Haloferax sp. wsp5]|nr:hypothetical protein C9J85_13655 [Haloferax sp. wsp5]
MATPYAGRRSRALTVRPCRSRPVAFSAAPAVRCIRLSKRSVYAAGSPDIRSQVLEGLRGVVVVWPDAVGDRPVGGPIWSHVSGHHDHVCIDRLLAAATETGPGRCRNTPSYCDAYGSGVRRRSGPS